MPAVIPSPRSLLHATVQIQNLCVLKTPLHDNNQTSRIKDMNILFSSKTAVEG